MAWPILAPCLPAAHPGGRPRPPDMREVGKALLYRLRSGGQWRRLPTDCPPHPPVYHYCRTWRHAGVWERRHDMRRGELREAAGRTRAPRAGSIDSQTVQTTDKGGAEARTVASVSVGASATSSSLSSVSC